MVNKENQAERVAGIYPQPVHRYLRPEGARGDWGSQNVLGYRLWRCCCPRRRLPRQESSGKAKRCRIETPWEGRQYHVTNDPDDKPNSFNNWEEAFNRPIADDLRFRIEYADADGVITEREIKPKSIHLIRQSPDVYIKAHCFMQNDERTFFSPRIRSTTNLVTGRRISDLGQYLRGRY